MNHALAPVSNFGPIPQEPPDFAANVHHNDRKRLTEEATGHDAKRQHSHAAARPQPA
jgi:hypothetical protein